MADDDDAVRAIVAQLVSNGSGADASDPGAPVVATMPAPGVTPAMSWGMPSSAAPPSDPASGWPTMSVGGYQMPQAPGAFAAPAPAPATPAQRAAAIGALVAPAAPKPTMGTLYGPASAPMTSNTQGLAALAQGVAKGLDGRDELAKQDAAQDALQDLQDGD